MTSTNREKPFWNNNEQIIAVAHRGGDGAGSEKENSLAAFTAAAGLGYGWFETDVVPTHDGVLLATHGQGFQIQPNRDLPTRRAIQSMSYAEAQKKLIVGGEPPATLNELLSSFPNAKWFIDPKVDKAVNPLIEILKGPSLELEKISIGCFGLGAEKRMQKVTNGLEKSRRERLCFSLNPFGRCGFAILAASDVKIEELEPRDRIAVNNLRRLNLLPDVKMYLKEHTYTSLHVPYRWVSHSTNLVKIAHDLNLKLATWTPNEVNDIQASIDKKVDCIMSDNISCLKEALLSENSNNPSLNSTAKNLAQAARQ